MSGIVQSASHVVFAHSHFGSQFYERKLGTVGAFLKAKAAIPFSGLSMFVLEIGLRDT